jgi:DNA primase
MGTFNRFIGYFIRVHGAFHYKGPWYKLDCPFCRGELKFGINTHKGYSHCFKCEYSKDLNRTVQDIELVEKHEVNGILLSYMDVKGFSLKTQEKPLSFVPHYQVLPEGYKSLSLKSDSVVGRVIKRYMVKKRGISDLTLRSAKVGYVDNPHDEYYGYVIFPIQDPINHNKIISFQARRVMGNGPKFKNPPVETFGKSALFYNPIALQFPKLYLVESIINVLTIGRNAGCNLGKHLSKSAVSMIKASKCEEVVLGLDPDAIDKAYKLALELSLHKKVKVLKLPEGQDVNDIGLKKTLEIEKNSEYLSYNKLLLNRY